MPTDTEKRIKELLVELENHGVNIIKLDGEALEKTLRELIQKNVELTEKIAKLEKESITEAEFVRRLGGEKNFDEKGVYKGGTSTSDQTIDPSKPVGKPAWSTGSDEIDKDWADFFAAHSTITEQDKPNWVKITDLSEADAVYNNGWTALTSAAGIANINNNNHTADYTEQGITIKDIKLSSTPKNQIVTQIQQEKVWRIFFAAHSDINNQADWKKIGASPSEAETIYNNGWKDQIKNIQGKVIAVYEESGEKVLNVDVLNVAIESLKKSCVLMADIKKQTSLHDIIPTYKQTEIEELAKSDNKLPAGYKSTDLIKQRETVRDGLWFNLTSADPRDKGIEQSLLDLAEQELKNVWAIKEYDELTPEILNDFLNACEGIKVNVGKTENGAKDGDNINQFLKDQGAFEIDEVEPEISAKEDKLPKSIRGTYSLPLFYKMNNYDYLKPDFCEWEELEVQGDKGVIKRKEVIDTTLPFNLDPKNNNPKKYTDKTIEYLKNKYFENGDIFTDGKFKLKGHLAIGTGVGKTTKTVNCLVYMMKQLFNVNNVILVCPTKPLVQSASNHHKSWLQKWGCVVHQKEVGKNSDGSPIYESHGSYKVEMNKLVDGLSIMEPKYLNSCLAATLCNTSVLDSSKGGKNITAEQKKQFEDNVAKIKNYAIPDGTLIVFDEADFTIPEYQEMIRDTIILTDDNDKPKFRVLKMSATFKGKKFSITSSYPIESYYTSGFQSGTPLKLEDRLAKGKTLSFLKSIDTKQTEKGVTILKKGTGKTGNGVCHVVYDSTYEAYMEGISFGLPKGALGIGDTRYGRGFTPDIQNTISTGLIEQTSLGAFCRYDKPQTQPFPLAEAAQQRGRSGRIQPGFWGTTSTNFEEVRIVPDLISDMVRATILGAVSKKIADLGAGFAAVKDNKTKVHMGVNFIRAGIALRMIEKNGEAPAPEEMLVGLQGLPEFPTFRTEYPTWKPDKNLWARYLGQPEPDAPNLDVERAKDLLKLMIQTYISTDPDFPNKLEIKMVSKLVQATSLTEAEARQVLNALTVKKINEAQTSDPTYDPVNKRGKNLATIQQIAALHKIVLPADKRGTKISMGIEKNDDGDEVYVLRMEYNVVSPTLRKIGLFDEKLLQEIRNLIKGEFKGKIKEEADKALRVDSPEGYSMFVKKLSENADLYNELVNQKRYESDANKFLYRIEKLAKEIETTQPEAKIEVIDNK